MNFAYHFNVQVPMIAELVLPEAALVHLKRSTDTSQTGLPGTNSIADAMNSTTAAAHLLRPFKPASTDTFPDKNRHRLPSPRTLCKTP